MGKLIKNFKTIFILLILAGQSALFSQGVTYIENTIRLSPQHNVYQKSNPQNINFIVHHPETILQGIYYQNNPVDYQAFSFIDIIVDEKDLNLPFTTKIDIDATFFDLLAEGNHELVFSFANGESRTAKIKVEEDKTDYEMEIISFNVEHGVSVFIQLPDENILIDTGSENMTKKRVIPELKKRGVTKIDHFIITHWHWDHYSGIEDIRAAFEIGEILFNLSEEGEKESGFQHNDIFTIGNEFSINDANFKVLNAARFDPTKFPAFKDEKFHGYTGKNNRSLSFNMEYKGFIYSHGGDIYQHPQKAILQTFGEDAIKAHIYHGNHHFHGGVSANYLKEVNPFLFITPANPAAYNRAAYVEQVMGNAVPYLEANSERFIENLFDFEVGHITISVNDSSDWRYETDYVNEAILKQK